MSWKQDAEYNRRKREFQTKSIREESLRQVRTNVAQILDALNEIQPQLKKKKIDRDFLSTFDEWFWKRNQKAKSAESEKTIAFINRIRRYMRIAVQLKISSDQIHRDFEELEDFFINLLKLYQEPESEIEEDLSYLERIEVLEKILFPRVGMEPNKGPDSCLVYLSGMSSLFQCLKVILTPTIPPVIPKKIDMKLFGISEKIVNIFNGITLNFVTDPMFFDITYHGAEGDELWKIPGISYQKVMEPFLSDFGVAEQKFFKALCGHIGLQIAESKINNEEYFLLDPSFVKIFYKIGYLDKKKQKDGKTVWYPKISEETLYLQYLSLVATNRIGVQPDFAFWISLTFAYYLYLLISEEYLSSDNCFRSFLKDDLVRVSIVPYSVKSIALQLGGIDWANKMPTDLESRKDILSGLLKITGCSINKLREKYDEIADEFWNTTDSSNDDGEVKEEQLLNDAFWQNK